MSDKNIRLSTACPVCREKKYEKIWGGDFQCVKKHFTLSPEGYFQAFMRENGYLVYQNSNELRHSFSIALSSEVPLLLANVEIIKIPEFSRNILLIQGDQTLPDLRKMYDNVVDFIKSSFYVDENQVPFLRYSKEFELVEMFEVLEIKAK